MKQQINLYQPMFRKQKKVFSAVTMLQICLFFTVVFVALYGYSLYQIAPLRLEVSKLDGELERLTTEMTKYQQQQPGKASSKLLEKELERVTKEIDEREGINKLLAKYTFNDSNRFSAYLEALARQHVAGTWLTKILINDGGASVGLEGKTLSSELVPVYIQQLANEKTLAGTAFNVMELHRSEGVEDQLNFKISTN